MMPSTKKAIEAVASADPSLSSKQIKAALAILADAGPTLDREPLDRILSRSEVATILGLSEKSIDFYARKGVLHRIYIGASSRASGILESSVRAVMEGGNAEGRVE